MRKRASGYVISQLREIVAGRTIVPWDEMVRELARVRNTTLPSAKIILAVLMNMGLVDTEYKDGVAFRVHVTPLGVHTMEEEP